MLCHWYYDGYSKWSQNSFGTSFFKNNTIYTIIRPLHYSIHTM